MCADIFDFPKREYREEITLDKVKNIFDDIGVKITSDERYKICDDCLLFYGIRKHMRNNGITGIRDDEIEKKVERICNDRCIPGTLKRYKRICNIVSHVEEKASEMGNEYAMLFFGGLLEFTTLSEEMKMEYMSFGL